MHRPLRWMRTLAAAALFATMSCVENRNVDAEPESEGRVTRNAAPHPAQRPEAGYAIAPDEAPKDHWPAAESRNLTNIRQVTRREIGLTKAGEAYFSPDMRMIIFQAYPEGETEYQMFTMRLSDTHQPLPKTLKQVSPGGGACSCGFFRPDGKRILYASSDLNPDVENPNAYHREGSTYKWNMPGGMDIFEADLDGSNRRRLTTELGYDAECAYDPTGQWIVFTSDRDGDPDLYKMRADGSDVRQLTNSPGYDGGPFFSPDGKRILFRSDRNQDEHLQLFVMDADGTGERQITRHGRTVRWAPFWLPDGHWIVYTTSIHGHYNYEVYLLNVDTGRYRRITYSPRFDGLPVISPDGKMMMWTSQRGPSGLSQVFLADFHPPTDD